MVRLSLSRLLPRLLALCLLVGASTHAGETPEHDLTALRTFTKVVISVKENYAQPERIKPQEMMVAALDYVEKAVPDVIAHGSPGKLTVTAGNKTREFDISGVDSLWKMSFIMKDVFQFIRENARPPQDTREVEYAATNGMLSTLDSRSALLPPKLYTELKGAGKTNASIGVVVQMKNNRLILRKALPKYPAAVAGLKRGDWITKIGGEPTEFMGLREAISKLRGMENSTVSITVERQGWDKPREFKFTRTPIRLRSLQHQLLPQGVGYVRLGYFQGDTLKELKAALAQLGQQAGPGGLKGLVLDMRGNSGGLLEQAIDVADLFLSQGDIVTAVGKPGLPPEVKHARAKPDDNTSPLAVLVDARSASATEIVAGALKYLNRAVIIGQRTYGKESSVQVLYDYPDGSALKLTIAHYLAPGGASLEDGVVPDIELEPIYVTRERVRLFGSRSSQQTATGRTGAPDGEKPAGRARYLETRSDEELDPELLEQPERDFQVIFARDFVLKAASIERDEMLRLGESHMRQRAREEEERLSQAIAALGIDWSPGPTPKAPNLAVTLNPGAEVKSLAGQVLDLEVTVENKGTEPVKRLRARMDSPDNELLDGQEFLFGAVNPGEQRSWKVAVPLPENLASRRDVVTVRLQDDSGMLAPSATAELDFVEAPRPAFAFSWQVQDRCDTCNGDGLVEPGETVSVRIDITNTGAGKATGVSAWVKNSSLEGVTLTDGSTRLGMLAPGETKTVNFQLKVAEEYRMSTVALKLSLLDVPLKESFTDELVLPVRQEAPLVKEQKAVVRLGKKTELLAAPEADARPLGRLLKDVVVRQVAQVDGFAKVMLDENRFAFVKSQDAKRGPKLKPTPVAAKVLEPAAPAPAPQRISISLDGVDPAQGGLVTAGDRFTLSGTAAFPHAGPADLYVLVNDQKVFFKTQTYAEASPEPLAFTTELPLKEGLNQVLVVASEGPDSSTHKTLVIRRRPASPPAP
jgi:carboxyl-terminal processing protease